MKKILAILLSILITISSVPAASAMGLLLPIKGDADADGKVTAADARLILRASVGLHTPFILRRSLYDCDNDGKISAADARKALRIAVGLEKFDNDNKTREERIKDFTDNVSAATLKNLMTEICALGTRSVLFPQKNLAAQEYISGRLREYNVNFKRQTFTYNGTETANIISTLKKGDENSEILLICTHFDCYDGNSGAIDNASGVAALLHTIEIIKKNEIGFNGEIRIAFLSAEEMGYYGAYRYVNSLSADEISRIKVFNIDMAGNSSLGGGKILTVSTEPVSPGTYPWRQAQENSVSKAIDSAKALLGNLGEEKYMSPVSAGRHDIVAFRKSGIPSVTLSWRETRAEAAYGSDFNLAPPSQIHTYLDTIENFNVNSLYNTTRLILASLLLGYSD